MSDLLLTAAAWAYIHWRAIAELAGLVLLVAAAALVDVVAGVAAAGVAFVLYATFGGRAS